MMIIIVCNIMLYHIYVYRPEYIDAGIHCYAVGGQYTKLGLGVEWVLSILGGPKSFKKTQLYFRWTPHRVIVV